MAGNRSPSCRIRGLGALVAVVATACSSEPTSASDATGSSGSGDSGGSSGQPLSGATVLGERTEYAWLGDLWMSTWMPDDSLLSTFGDGTGLPACIPLEGGVLEPASWGAVEERPGCFAVPVPPADAEDPFHDIFCRVNDCAAACYPTCAFADTGLVQLRGTLPDLDPCSGTDGCVVARNLPDDPGTLLEQNDKPSSILAIDGTVVFAGHRPAGLPTRGYLATSDDAGATWSEIEGSPWDETTPFRVVMFIQMGRAHELDVDGYVYALAVEAEADHPEPNDVYLGRVPRESVASYDAWDYLTGIDAEVPQWGVLADASPVPGLQTRNQGSALWHDGTQRYLFLTAHDRPQIDQGGLWEAPHPWGPWTRVADLFGDASDPAWDDGGYVPGLVPKNAGSDTVWFTLAGGHDHYTLSFGQLRLEH